MLKNYYLYACMSVLCSLLLWSCFKDDDDGRIESQTTPLLSVEKAREFFENQLTQSVKVRTATTQENHCGYMPGDFTPLWSKAKTSSDSDGTNIDVPILAKHCFKAIRSELTNEVKKSYTVDITQKLIVVKSKHHNSIGLFIVTLIPDQEYAKKNKRNMSDKFLHSGSHNFSGIALYSHQSEGYTTNVLFFKDGKIVNNVSLWCEKELLASRVELANNLETKFIKAGTLIGYVGKTGSASSPDAAGAHLHLQIRKDNSSGDVLNPHNYIYSKYSKDANWRYLNNGKPDNPC